MSLLHGDSCRVEWRWLLSTFWGGVERHLEERATVAGQDARSQGPAIPSPIIGTPGRGAGPIGEAGQAVMNPSPHAASGIRSPVPCQLFQAELARDLRERGHDIVEEFPVGRHFGDILDRTTGEWLELDRVMKGFASPGAFRARLEREGAIFRQPEVASLGMRKIFWMDIQGALAISADALRAEVERWLSSCSEGCAPDEVRLTVAGQVVRVGRESGARP